MNDDREIPVPGHVVTVEADIRSKNQITVPKRVADIAGFQTGDRVVFIIDECDPTEVRIHALRKSYARALEGVYGDPAEIDVYLRDEREAWDQ